MERIEFCKILQECRKKSGCKMKDICFALNVIPTAVYRLEKGKNSFNVSTALKFLEAIKYIMVVYSNNGTYLIRTYEDAIKYIKDARAGKYTQRELAELIGYSHITIANIETMKCIAGIDTFLKIADVLGYTIKIVDKQ